MRNVRSVHATISAYRFARLPMTAGAIGSRAVGGEVTATVLMDESGMEWDLSDVGLGR